MKVVNYQHMMPTRYTLDLDLKTAVPTDATETSEKRKTARQVKMAARRAACCFGFWSPPCCDVTVLVQVLLRIDCSHMRTLRAGFQAAVRGQVQDGQEPVVLQQTAVLSLSGSQGFTGSCCCCLQRARGRL